MEMCLRHRRPVLAVLAALAGWLTLPLPPDLPEFAALGDRLLRGQLDGVYRTTANQAGPLQLLLSRLLVVGGDATPHPVTVAAIDAALVLAAMAMCRRLSTDRGAALVRQESVVGLLTVLWLAAPLPWNGHPAELAVPVGWMYATALQRRGRWVPAGVLLGLCVAVAPWAVLGLPCLLGAADPGSRLRSTLRYACRTGVLACAVGAAWYLPFVLTGRFALPGLVWAVDDGTLAHLFGLRHVTWGGRLVQGAVVAAGCGWVAWWLRGRPLVVAVAPLAAGLLRVVSDPVRLGYYWAPVAVSSLMVLATVGGTRPGRQWVSAVLLAYLPYLAAAVDLTVPGALLCLVLAAHLAAGELGRRADGGDHADRAPAGSHTVRPWPWRNRARRYAARTSPPAPSRSSAPSGGRRDAAGT